MYARTVFSIVILEIYFINRNTHKYYFLLFVLRLVSSPISTTHQELSHTLCAFFRSLSLCAHQFFDICFDLLNFLVTSLFRISILTVLPDQASTERWSLMPHVLIIHFMFIFCEAFRNLMLVLIVCLPCQVLFVSYIPPSTGVPLIQHVFGPVSVPPSMRSRIVYSSITIRVQ